MLDAIKASGGGGKGKDEQERDGEEKKRRKDKKMTPAPGLPEKVKRHDKKDFSPSSSSSRRRGINDDVENPIKKAQKILGKRTMMSKGELLSAVGDLEQEYKKKK